MTEAEKNTTESIATLAKLAMSMHETEELTENMTTVLEYMDILEEVDVTGVPEKTQVTGLVDVVRVDQALPSGEEVIASLFESYPSSSNGLLKVPGIFD